jgi:hypothetical protein
LLQRILDDQGFSTISLTQVAEITAIIKPSRSLFIAHPFGLTFGDVGDTATQNRVVDALLDAATSMSERGIRDGGFTWTKDDLRDRQLRKVPSPRRG